GFFQITTSTGTREVNLRATYGVQHIDRSLEIDASSSESLYPPTVRVVQLETNHLAFDPFSKLLYATVPSSVVGIGNSITAIDPAKASIGKSVFVGSEPYRLAISDDGSFIYADLEGADAIRRYAIATQAADLEFS